jgi:integrase
MSVYKRGGVYWYDFWFEGQRYRQTTKLTNKTSAERAEAIRKAELAEGRAGIACRGPCPTFESFVKNEFTPWSEKQHAAHPNTHERYQTSAKPLISFFGKLTLDAIKSRHVERFKLFRCGEISAAGTNRDLAALRLMFNFANRLELVSRNPVKGVKFLPEGPGAMRAISHDEERRYMAAANPLLRDVATLIVETGMRPQEVFAIRPENVHLTKRYLFVPSGKTRFARRNIPLTESAIKVLKRRLRKARGAFLFWHKSDVNRPLTTVQKAHENAIKKAKMKEPFRLYDFRHTFGSRSAMAGVDLATLKELMGHSHISITMKYVHPTPEHKREAVNKLEHFNIKQVFAMHENLSGSPQESPQ